MSKELIDKLLKASEKIHKSSTKGTANYMITSPEVANMLKSIYKVKCRKEKIKRIFNDETREI